MMKAIELLPPPFVGTWGIAVFANAPHPNASKVFVDWYLSREGQEAQNETRDPSIGFSRRTDVVSPDPDDTPDWSRWDSYVSPNQEKDISLTRQVIGIYNSAKK
jgi:ABC-type Fe3+ transport system substrate-binding protein